MRKNENEKPESGKRILWNLIKSFAVLCVMGWIFTAFIESPTGDQVLDAVAKEPSSIVQAQSLSFTPYDKVSYKEAFEIYFGEPKWRQFKTKGGSDTVEFTGQLLNEQVPVKTLIEFTIISDDIWGITFLSIDDEFQSSDIANILLHEIFINAYNEKGYELPLEDMFQW